MNEKLITIIKNSFDKYKNNNFYIDKNKKNQIKTYIHHGKTKIIKQNFDFIYKTYNEVFNDVINLSKNLENYIIKNYQNKIQTIGILSENSYNVFLLILSSIFSKNYIIFPIYNKLIDKENLIKNLKQINLLYIENDNIDIMNLYSKIMESNNECNIDIIYNISFDSSKQYCFSDLLKPNFFNENKNVFYEENFKENLYKYLSPTNYNIYDISELLITNTLNDISFFECFYFNEHDIYYIINSLNDITELIFILNIIINGGQIFINKNFSDLFEEIEYLHPTILNTYSCIWKKIYNNLNKIINSLNETKKKEIFKILKVKYNELNNVNNESDCWDKLIFDKIKYKFGGKIKYIFITNDILNPFIQKFFKICLKAKIIKIYGITELCGFISINEENINENYFNIGKNLNSRKLIYKKLDKNICFPFNLKKFDNYQNKLISNLEVEYNNYIYNTNDLILNNDNEIYFLGKKNNMLKIEDKIINSLYFESILFLERIDNFYLFVYKNNIFLICHLNYNNINIENIEYENEKLRNEIKNYIENKYKFLKNFKIYFIQDKKYYDSKYKINRKILYNEIIKNKNI